MKRCKQTGFVLDNGKGKFVKNPETCCSGDESGDVEEVIGVSKKKIKGKGTDVLRYESPKGNRPSNDHLLPYNERK